MNIIINFLNLREYKDKDQYIYICIYIYMKFMFPLIAISAFFLLGFAFFIFGKDDFGITRVNEVSKDTKLKGNKATNLDSISINESTEENKELVNSEVSPEINPGSNASV